MGIQIINDDLQTLDYFPVPEWVYNTELPVPSDIPILPLSVIHKIADSKNATKFYLLTLTRDSKVATQLEWFDDVVELLELKMHNFIAGSIEHIESNIHCHAMVSSKHNIDKSRYKKFIQKHRIDCRKISKDNGISEYIGKENPSFDNILDFKLYYLNKIKNI